MQQAVGQAVVGRWRGLNEARAAAMQAAAVQASPWPPHVGFGQLAVRRQ